MPIDCQQLRDIVVNPTCIALGMFSTNATQLLLGTCAQETEMGTYLVQQGIGMRGGIGIWQMQLQSFNAVWDRVVAPDVAMRAKLRLLLGYEGKPVAERMATDLRLACAMTRLYYHMIAKPLPAIDDIEGMANYWKVYYNSALGKGTPSEFIENYKKYVR